MTRGWIILALATAVWLIAIALILASAALVGPDADLRIALAAAAIFAGLVWIATMGGRAR